MTNQYTAFAALADPMRAAIVELLSKKAMPVGELASQLPVSRPAVSQHLKILKDAKLVADRAEGTRRIYSIDRAGLRQIRQWLDRFWECSLQSYAAAVEGEKEK